MRKRCQPNWVRRGAGRGNTEGMVLERMCGRRRRDREAYVCLGLVCVASCGRAAGRRLAGVILRSVVSVARSVERRSTCTLLRRGVGALHL